MVRWFAIALVCVSASTAVAADPPAKPSPEQIDFFEKKVRPLLADNCYSCHGAKKQSAGLRLDTAAGLKAGADGAAIVVAGDPANSKLVRAVKREGDFPMPPKKPLPADAVATLTEWVKSGAVIPDDSGTTARADPKNHWAFQPPRLPAIPSVNRQNPTAVNNPIDAFVTAKLSDRGLSPSPRADRRTLARRAYFDLIGLPPTAEELDAFEKDNDPQAWEKLIDKLLASPAYGERWGRYWLDLARYADTKGYVFNEDRNYPFAYTYRDYVIRSLNEDKPYDRFIQEQLAADRLLPTGAEDKRSLAAIGFLTLGRRFLNNTPDIIDDRIDVVMRGLMGLTVGCARCHDHKFDPIPTADYYSLYGVFDSIHEPKELPLIDSVKRTPEVIAFEKEVEKRESAFQAEIARRHSAHLKKLRQSAAVADYLRAIYELKGKLERPLQSSLRERDLNVYAFQRWQAFLAAETKTWSPVYSVLSRLQSLSEKDFTNKAPVLVDKLAENAATSINPLVLIALTEKRLENFKAAVAAVAAVVVEAGKDIVGPPTVAQTEASRSARGWRTARHSRVGRGEASGPRGHRRPGQTPAEDRGI